MTRKIILISIPVLLIVLITVCAFLGNVPLEKTMNVQGYTISIPEKWSSDSKGNFYDKNGNQAGAFTLVGKESEHPPALDNVKSEISRDFLSDTILKYEFSDDGNDVIIYYIKDLPNPEPYAAELVFYNEHISKKMAEKIYNTFTMPQIGSNPPLKNISVPENIKENAVYISDSEVLNIEILNEFIEKLLKKENAGADIFEYTKDDGLKHWYSLESEKGTGYLYSYYEKADGIYTYDNSPVIFESISKEISDKEETTAYILKSNGKEDTNLIKIPLDRYRDNAKELLALKTDKADSERVREILEKILSFDEINGLNVELNEKNVVLKFSENVKSDRGKAYSQSAILFSLAANVDSVTAEYNDGKQFTFLRNEVNNKTKSDVNEAAVNEKDFIKYTEEIKETQENVAREGEVVYSGAVVISYNTMVTHPRTGERVAIGPYAEERGYGGYLGKTINCVIKRSGNGYIATASCGGSVIASYPLNSESELNWAIGMIRAYS